MMFNKLKIKKFNSRLKIALKTKKLKNKKKDTSLLNQLKLINPSNKNVKNILKLQNQNNPINPSENVKNPNFKKNQVPNEKNILSNENLILKTLQDQVNKIKNYDQYKYKNNVQKSLLKVIKQRLKLKENKQVGFFIPINYKLNHIKYYLEKDKTPYSNSKPSKSSNDETKNDQTTSKKQDSWINKLNHNEIIILGKLFVFFDKNFSNLDKKSIDDFFNLNFYSCYKKILHTLKTTS